MYMYFGCENKNKIIITRVTFSGVPKRLWQAYTKQTFVGPNCSHVAYNLKTLLCCGLFVRSGDPQSYICPRVAVIGQMDKTPVLPIIIIFGY